LSSIECKTKLLLPVHVFFISITFISVLSRIFGEIFYLSLGAVHKRRPQSGGGGCPVRKTGVFRCEPPHFRCKNVGFFKIYECVSTDKGSEPVRTYFRIGGQFCAEVLYGRPLMLI